MDSDEKGGMLWSRISHLTRFPGPDYDPITGAALDTWQDVNLTGVYVPGVDSKTVFSQTPVTTNTNASAGSTTTDLSNSGVQTDTSTDSNSGLTTSRTTNGLTTTTVTQLNVPEGGDVTVTTTNPDGTQIKDAYTHGLLTDEQTLGTDGTTVITDTSYGYDALGRNNSVTDWTGTTTYTLRADGSVAGVLYPDGRTTSVPDVSGKPNIDAKTGAALGTTLANGQTQSQTLNALGQQITQSGAGVLPARFGYDPSTGAMTSLKLFQSGTVDSGTAETTSWLYDPATGLLSKKTYADGTTDVYTYNNKFQVTDLTRGLIDTTFKYNKAGQQTSSTATDNATGQEVHTSTASYDDQGRPTSVTQTTSDAGGGTQSAATNTYGYDANGNLTSETQAANATTVFDYYATNDTGTNAEPGAVKDEKIMQGATELSETDYGYDPASKRVETVTVESFVGGTLASSQAFTYVYKTGTNLIASITAGAVSTSFGYEATTGRLSSIGTTADGSNLFTAGYTYTQLDQQHTADVSQTDAEGDTNAGTLTYGYNAQNELTSAVLTTGDSTLTQNYSYDGAGNRNDDEYASEFGTANTVNQYSNLTYNTRGEELSNGPFAFTWNAADEMTSATAGDHSVKITNQYDANGRRVEKDTYAWDAGDSDWTLSGVRKFVYAGRQLIGEFAGSGNEITGYTWSGTTLLSVTDYTQTVPKTYMAISDATGNVRSLIDPSTGAVVATYRYDAYGNLLSADGPAANVCNIRYGGGYADPETGLVLLGAGIRFYDPVQGRFISRDPIAEAGGLNEDVYCGDDPVNRSDPSGTKSAWNEVLNAFDASKCLIYMADPPVQQVFNQALLDEIFGPPSSNSSNARYPGASTGAVLDAEVDGFQVGWTAGSANALDKITFQQIPCVHYSRNKIWADTGMAGTSVETASNAAAWTATACFYSAAGIAAAQAAAPLAGRVVVHGAVFMFEHPVLTTRVMATLSATVIASLFTQSGRDMIAQGSGDPIGMLSGEVRSVFGAFNSVEATENLIASSTLCFVAGTDVLLGDGKTEEPINDIHVGQRVDTDGGVANSSDGKTKSAHPNATKVNRKTWRLVTIEAGDWEVQTLEPLSWIKAEHLVPGESIHLADVVDLAEMGVPTDLVGTVEAITACPAIQGGTGRVVLTTVNHLNNYLFHLTLADTSGHSDTLGITGYHKVYTEDRGWVSTADLKLGEAVRGDHGDLTVTGLAADPGTFRVYNMTVETDHVYYVGDLEALTHNVNCADASAELRTDLTLAGKPILPYPAQQAAHVVPSNGPSNASQDVLDAVKRMQTQFDDFFGLGMRNRELNGFGAKAGHDGSHLGEFYLDLDRDMNAADTELDLMEVIDVYKELLKKGHYSYGK